MAQSRTVRPRDKMVASGVDPQIADGFENIPHKDLVLSPKDAFFDAGGEHLVFVRRGVLAKYPIEPHRKRQILALYFAGDGVLPHDSSAPFMLQPMVRSELWVSRADDVRAIIESSPDLLRFFLHVVQRKEAISQRWLATGNQRAQARVAHLLCETAARLKVKGDRFELPFSQRQIGEITGQTNVNVNRILADLEREGLIQRSGREMQFNDWSAMWRIANFSPEYLN
jgi:CRP-like cAMP-binding protein